MDYFVVDGGFSLRGSVNVSGAKNAILPMISASLLAEDGITVLRNVPDNADIRTMLAVVRHLGAEAEYDHKKSTIKIDASKLNSYEAPYELVKKMRASFLVMGPLLSRFGVAKVSQPGGCAIGARPVDQHIRGFQKLGAKIQEEHGYTIARAKRLTGRVLHFDRPSHTGTENIIMSAVLAEGTTTIINAAQDPEVVDLCKFLNRMGAKIKGAGTSRITIDGVTSLKAVKYTPIGDRLEAGTFLFAAAATAGRVKVIGCPPEHLSVVLFKLEDMGASIMEGADWVELHAPKRLSATDIITDPYPGFPTDLQPVAMAALCIANGTSVIWERIFENRFLHVMELQRLGANIVIVGDRATIIGTEKLSGASIMASDIRAGAGLIVAALSASGRSTIRRVYHIDRGYSRIEQKLSVLGAKIERRSE